MVINVNTEVKPLIPLGMQYENGVNTVEFDVSEWEESYGSGTLIATVQRNGDDTPYPLTLENNVWVISETDTEKRGRGKVQLSWIVNGKVKKSVVIETLVQPSLNSETVDPPDPLITWFDRLIELGSEVERNTRTVHDDTAVATSKASEASSSASNAATSATNANTSATNSETQALKSEGFAVGKQNGSEVSSDSGYYHNNAKYYSEQASESQTSASSSATYAEDKSLISEGYAVGKQNGIDVDSTSHFYENNSKYYAQQASVSESNALHSASSAASSAQQAAQSASIFVIDDTLTQADQAADAKATGDTIATKVSKSGDTMTGNLTLDNSSSNGISALSVRTFVDYTETAPESDLYLPIVRVDDKNNTRIGSIYSFRYADDRGGIQIEANRIVNGESINNCLRLIINPDGTRSIGLTDSYAWRTALDAVGKSGNNTLTGQLALDSSSENGKSLLIVKTSGDFTEVPESNQYLQALRILDKNGEKLATIQGIRFTDNKSGLQIETNRVVNDSNIYNTLRLMIADDGTKSVLVSDPKVWRDALGISEILGNSSMGTTATTITGAIAEHEGDISTLNSNLNSVTLGSNIITVGTGISIVTANIVKNKYAISMRVACKKTDGSVFSGRINPLFTIAEGYRPKYPFTVAAVTNSSVSSYMTGYCCAYITTGGAVIIDTITANQKEIDIHVCYLL